jgi:hypothetical protein
MRNALESTERAQLEGERVQNPLLHPPNKLPSEMSDEELLRFGMVAKYMCSQGEKLEREKLEAFTLQLDGARKEWKKRFPKLPLSPSY